MMTLGICVLFVGLILAGFAYLTELGLKGESRSSRMMFLASAGMVILGAWFVQGTTV